MKKLNKTFFASDSEIVAKNLIWKIIKVWEIEAIITETEAYKWACDEASHAYPKKTPRNSLMYETYWKVYVYLIYGMYYCLNFTSDKTKPWAVLIRWVKIISWIEKALENRKSKNLKNLSNGPWKLTQALKIDKSFNSLDLEKTNKIGLFDNNIFPKKIIETPRVWIKKAVDKKWRYVGEF